MERCLDASILAPSGTHLIRTEIGFAVVLTMIYTLSTDHSQRNVNRTA